MADEREQSLKDEEARAQSEPMACPLADRPANEPVGLAERIKTFENAKTVVREPLGSNPKLRDFALEKAWLTFKCAPRTGEFKSGDYIIKQELLRVVQTTAHGVRKAGELVLFRTPHELGRWHPVRLTSEDALRSARRVALAKGVRNDATLTPDDAAHDALTKVWNNPTYLEEPTLKGKQRYLAKTTVNAIHDFYRWINGREGQRQFVPVDDRRDMGEWEPDCALAREKAERLKRFWRKLYDTIESKADRDILVALRKAEWNPGEAAKLLGRTSKTVSNAKSRIMVQIAALARAEELDDILF